MYMYKTVQSNEHFHLLFRRSIIYQPKNQRLHYKRMYVAKSTMYSLWGGSLYDVQLQLHCHSLLALLSLQPKQKKKENIMVDIATYTRTYVELEQWNNTHTYVKLEQYMYTWGVETMLLEFRGNHKVHVCV